MYVSWLLLVDEISLVISLSFGGLSVYRALAARRAVVGTRFRNRSLWTSVVAAYLAFLFLYELSLDFGFRPPYEGNYSGSLEAAFYYIALFGAGATMIWVWLDSAIGVALDLDFFHRDLLLWRRGARRAMWGILLIGVFLPILPFPLLSTDAAIGSALDGVLLFVPLAYASAILVLGYTRVTDELLRGFTKWIGLMVAALLVAIVVFPSNIPFVFVAYFLYRGASSLSLRSKIEPVN